MRHSILVSAICAAMLAASCQNSVTGPTQPTDSNKHVALESGKLVVRVYWDTQGLSGKRVDVLELHRTRTTDAAGYATFVLPVGDYTVRVYDINRGGPPRLYIDTKVTVTLGQESFVGVFDCLPCV